MRPIPFILPILLVLPSIFSSHKIPQIPQQSLKTNISVHGPAYVHIVKDNGMSMLIVDYVLSKNIVELDCSQMEAVVFCGGGDCLVVGEFGGVDVEGEGEGEGKQFQGVLREIGHRSKKGNKEQHCQNGYAGLFCLNSCISSSGINFLNIQSKERKIVKVDSLIGLKQWQECISIDICQNDKLQNCSHLQPKDTMLAANSYLILSNKCPIPSPSQPQLRTSAPLQSKTVRVSWSHPYTGPSSSGPVFTYHETRASGDQNIVEIGVIVIGCCLVMRLYRRVKKRQQVRMYVLGVA